MKQLIPVTAICGFLGSGKTTLLNQILEQADGRRIAVIINDYGEINIDAGLVAGKTDDTLQLTNGCVCCSLDNQELADVIEKFTGPDSQIDHVVIEASGLAEPADLSRVLSASTGRYAQFDALIGLVDATNIPAEDPELRLVHDAVKAADMVVVTKTDIASAQQTADAVEFVTNIAPTSRIVESGKDGLPLSVLLDSLEPRPADTSQHGDHEHAHEQFMSFVFHSDRPLDPAKFQEFVNKQLPSSIYRAKGWVDLGEAGLNHKYIYQLVGKRADIHWEEWGEQKPVTQLVFIGRKFDAAELETKLRACVAGDIPADVTIVARPKAAD